MLLTFAGISAGCVHPPPAALEDAPVSGLQWPPRPAPARIVWVRTIAGQHDLGIAPGFWQRALNFFIGTSGPRILRPHGVLYDARGRLLVADPGAGAVHCFDFGGKGYFLIGGKELQVPIGLAVDDRQHLYITDAGTGGVYRYDFARRTLEALLPSPLQRPTGIAWNPADGRLYVVDTTAGQVVAINREGIEESRIGGGDGPVQFNRPTGIWADARGQLYVVDSLNASIKVFAPSGQLLRQFGIRGDSPGEFNKPKGVATDSAGHIYVTDALLDAVQIFDQQGQPLLTFGAAGTVDGEFWMPSGVFIDGDNRIFVADTYNRRIQVFRYLPGNGPDDPSAEARTRP